MPRHTRYLLRWVQDVQIYELTGTGDPIVEPQNLRPDKPLWPNWLETVTSFAFASRSGTNYTVRKEKVQRGGAYWYGYRSVQGKTVKRYIGRTADLSIDRLEEIAVRLRNKPLKKKADEDVVTRWLIPTVPSSALESVATQMTPLLESKLYPPRPSASLVVRPQLYSRLDTASTHKLTLLSTPAGYGKTTAVTQWLAERHSSPSLFSDEARTSPSRSSPPVAWTTLDDGDNDPMRFLRYLIAACQTFHSDIGRSALASLSNVLQPPFELPAPEILLTFVLNDIVHYVTNGLLILDDYHVITEPAIHKAMTFFIDHLPSTLHVMLLTRSEPPLPLLRWRARGEVQDIHTAHLRFSPEETATFLHQSEGMRILSLSSEMIQQLTERLEGWAAGLRLLLLTLQGQTGQHEVERHLARLARDPIVSINSLAAPQGNIVKYFVSEVLSAQSEEIQFFLLQTSLLSPLTGSLCDSVTGKADSGTLLATLEKAGLFLESLDGLRQSEQWYRYHALFAEAMQSEAQRRLGDARSRELSLLASQWYEQHGMLIEAVEATLHAQEVQRAVDLIEKICEHENFYEPHTLLRWMEQLPESVFPSHLTLCFYYALALHFTRANMPFPQISADNMTERIDEMLRLAEKGWHDVGNLSRLGEIAAFRALVAWQTEDLRSAATYARKALEQLPIRDQDQERTHRENIQWRSVCLAVLGMEAAEERGLDEARQFLLQAYKSSPNTQNRGFIRATVMMLVATDLAQGELRQPAEAIRQVLAEAREENDWGDVTYALFYLSGIYYEWNNLEMVEQLANEAFELGKYGMEAEMRDLAFLRLALVQQRQGDTRSAQQHLITLLARLLNLSPAPLKLIFEALEWLIRLQLALGDTAAAQRHLEILSQYEKQASAALRFKQDMLQIRLLLARGETLAALARLEQHLGLASAKQQMHNVLEILILMTLAYVANKQEAQARKMLQRVLFQAQDEGFIRLFIDEGEPLAAVLHSLLVTVRDKGLYSYMRRLLDSFQIEHDNAVTGSDSLPVEPLSAQESRVLRLLAAGLTNPEIASELVISVNTVKDHVKHLYHKLRVNNRIAASEIARRLHLS